VVTITDDDGSTVDFATNAISVAEDTNTVTISIFRTGATNTQVSINYATLTTGTATINSDFTGTTGTVVFAAGVVSNSFDLAIFNDGVAETNETINLRLSSPTNTTLGASNMTVTITTNDSAVIGFAAATASVTESNGASVTLTINRSGTTFNLATVDYAT